jgi:hypothetical protein
MSIMKLKERGLKGFVFNIDAIFAISIMVIFIAASFLLIAKSSEDSYANLEKVRMGKDLLAVMEKSGKFSLDNLSNSSAIEEKMNESLPRGSGFFMNVDTYKQINGTFAVVNSSQYGQPLPKGTNVYWVRRDFVTQEGGETEYNVARLWIW